MNEVSRCYACIVNLPQVNYASVNSYHPTHPYIIFLAIFLTLTLMLQLIHHAKFNNGIHLSDASINTSCLIQQWYPSVPPIGDI